MDDRQFDALVRTLVQSRRAAMAGLLALSASVIAVLDPTVEASNKKKRKKRKKRRQGDVCSEANGACGEPVVPCGPPYCSGCCREDNTCVSIFGVSDRDCGFFGGACLDCGADYYRIRDRTHCCGESGSTCSQCCKDEHCQGHANGNRCCDYLCRECCNDDECSSRRCCDGRCIEASDCCCRLLEVCVLPWQGQPQDRHCCPNNLVCEGSQTGCCSPGMTCVPRVDPPDGTPTHACVTG